jgi:pyruvate dehydrogenase (quinone)
VSQTGEAIRVMTVTKSSTAEQLVQVLRQAGVDGIPDLQTDHYAAIARAAGIHTRRVDQPADVRATLQDALSHPGPALVDLVTDPNAMSIPPHITGEQVKGFAVAASKIGLTGGVGRMLELTRSNARNIPRPAVVR